MLMRAHRISCENVWRDRPYAYPGVLDDRSFDTIVRVCKVQAILEEMVEERINNADCLRDEEVVLNCTVVDGVVS